MGNILDKINVLLCQEAYEPRYESSVVEVLGSSADGKDGETISLSVSYEGVDYKITAMKLK